MANSTRNMLPGNKKKVSGHLASGGEMNRDVLQPSYAPDLPENPPSLGKWFADLVDVALSGNQDAIRHIGSLFAREYRGPDRREVQGRISSAMQRRLVSLNDVRSVSQLPVDGKSRVPLVEEQPWPPIPLLLGEQAGAALSRFVAEAANSKQLSEAGLGSRLNLLLSGPPGTGKTFIAGHIAARLGLPFHIVRLDTVVSSLLGDTAKNIRALFEFASNGPGFLFLDEVDAIAKRRDDQRELGEIKRVVNTLIQGLDLIHDRTVIVAATNHAHLLDPAIFRRFPYQIEVGLPELDLREALWRLYLNHAEDCVETAILSVISKGLSCSDIRELAIAARRTAVLTGDGIDFAGLAWAVIGSREGKLHMPPVSNLEPEAKGILQERLRDDYELTFEKIGRLTGVSKQAVIATLRRRKNVDKE
ncbi:AAA family ATPase [Microvirga flavescens]|uniref:AAA family ATPase n=1 Tax=Microvirga flavescens TaxID=2249811 RepID=UPI000DD69305|nr:AAA family ATPase [Microvirga flavescens]